MLTEAQFRQLSALAWDYNGEGVCRTPINQDLQTLVDTGLAAARIDDNWTTLILTPKGLRQLAS